MNSYTKQPTEHLKDVRRAFVQHYGAISKYGAPLSPRGMDTKYLDDVKIQYQAGYFPVRQGGNPAIGLMETLQFISGSFSKSALNIVAPNAKLDLFTERGAYGPRTRGQFEEVIEAIKSDKQTRRGVVMIAFPLEAKHELPCTLSMHFRVTLDNTLLTTVNMRSSDAVWGLPYDMIQFGGIAMAVAHSVGAEPGRVLINMANAHIYDETSLGSSVRVGGGKFELPVFHDAGNGKTAWDRYSDWALDIVNSEISSDELYELLKVSRGMLS